MDCAHPFLILLHGVWIPSLAQTVRMPPPAGQGAAGQGAALPDVPGTTLFLSLEHQAEARLSECKLNHFSNHVGTKITGIFHSWIYTCF